MLRRKAIDGKEMEEDEQTDRKSENTDDEAVSRKTLRK